MESTSRYGSFVANHLDVRSLQGDEALCICQFHPDRNPSMVVNVRKGLFYCRSCNASGKIEKLARHVGIELEDESVPISQLRKRCRDMMIVPANEIPIQTLPESWLGKFDFPHSYWSEKRGFDPTTVQQFGLGYDPLTNRGTIPLRDSHGKLMGVIYRRFDSGRPKYLYPKGLRIGRVLFGSWKVRAHHKRIAIVEGSLDAVACWQARIPAVALLGSRLSPDQAKLIRSLGIRSVVTMTDNDQAGYEAVISIKDGLPGINVSVGWYRPAWRAKDPGELKAQRRRTMFLSPRRYQEWLAD